LYQLGVQLNFNLLNLVYIYPSTSRNLCGNC